MGSESAVKALLALRDNHQLARVKAAARQSHLTCSIAGEWRAAFAAWEQDEFGVLVTGAVPDAGDGVRLIHDVRSASGSYCTPAILFLGGDEDAWAAAQAAGADQCLPAGTSERLLAASLAAAARRVRMRRQAEAALGRAEAMAEAVPDGIVTIDAKGMIRWANAGALSMFGYERPELLGRDVGLLAPEPHRSAHGRYVRDYRETGVKHVLGFCREVTGRRKDGSIFPLELSVSEFRHGGTSSFIGVLRDVSQRKAAEDEVAEKAARLERLRARNQTENEFAREVVERLLRTHSRDDPLLRYHVAPAEEFSGDVVAALRSPAGRLYVMLADATGHGLAAAISLLPAMSVFYGMAGRNLPLEMIVREMNDKLRTSMPVGRFIAAALACIDEGEAVGEIWVGATPDLFLLDGAGRVQRRFPSNRVALGILDSSPLYAQPEIFRWTEASQLFVCSDGVVEAQNARGEHFGIERLIATVAGCGGPERIETVRAAVDRHIDGVARPDDISLLSIDLPGRR